MYLISPPSPLLSGCTERVKENPKSLCHEMTILCSEKQAKKICGAWQQIKFATKILKRPENSLKMYHLPAAPAHIV